MISEDSFLTLDGYRRRLTLYGCNQAEWIEGIGNTEWLTRPTYLGSVSGGNRLTCFYDSTQLVYALFDGSCASFFGVDDAESSLPFKVYPNPASGSLILSDLPEGQASVMITDLFGRPLLNCDGSPARIDISSLTDGLYFLTVQLGKARRTVRIEKFDRR